MFHSQALLYYLYDDNFSISANTIFTTIKEDRRAIIESIIEGMDIQEDTIKSELRNLLITFNDVVAISSDDLEPSKLLPHHIELIDGAKPIKQRAYRLSHI